MNVILSIHPEWAKLIYEGKKTLELRKRIPMNTVNIVYLYETDPICKVTGFFKFFAYTRITKTRLELNKDILTDKSCVPLEEIKKYFGKSKEIYGWFCYANRKENKFAIPVKLSEIGIKRAPQSWIYTKFTIDTPTIDSVERFAIRDANKKLAIKDPFLF